MTVPEQAVEMLRAGLDQLLAAIHADDPKRELLVRVGDLMREAAALPLMGVEWQPIETAPKPELLVGSRFLFGRWDEDRFDWIVSGFFDAHGKPWHDGKHMKAFEGQRPTHFRKFDWALVAEQREVG